MHSAVLDAVSEPPLASRSTQAWRFPLLIQAVRARVLWGYSELCVAQLRQRHVGDVDMPAEKARIEPVYICARRPLIINVRWHFLDSFRRCSPRKLTITELEPPLLLLIRPPLKPCHEPWIFSAKIMNRHLLCASRGSLSSRAPLRGSLSRRCPLHHSKEAGEQTQKSIHTHPPHTPTTLAPPPTSKKSKWSHHSRGRLCSRRDTQGSLIATT